jgi:hypothetical protein
MKRSDVATCHVAAISRCNHQTRRIDANVFQRECLSIPESLVLSNAHRMCDVISDPGTWLSFPTHPDSLLAKLTPRSFAGRRPATNAAAACALGPAHFRCRATCTFNPCCGSRSD